jgi:hypothetical protein
MASMLVIGGIVSGVNHVLSFTAVVTAAVTGTARYAVVLSGAGARLVERATALGFFLGIPITGLFFAIDQIGVG